MKSSTTHQNSEGLTRVAISLGQSVSLQLLNYSKIISEITKTVLGRLPEYWQETFKHVDATSSPFRESHIFYGEKYEALHYVFMDLFLDKNRSELYVLKFTKEVGQLEVAKHLDLDHDANLIKHDLKPSFDGFFEVHDAIFPSSNQLQIPLQLIMPTLFKEEKNTIYHNRYIEEG